MLRKLSADTGGATAIEYGLIVALIAVAIVSALQTLGVGTGSLYGQIDQTVTDAI
jgi:pilus assembly protein Flp/PilA